MDIQTAVAAKNTWIESLTAITPIAIAFFVALIGWLQWKTADAKLQLDRYERRFEVYAVTVRFYNRLFENLEDDRVGFDKLRMEFLEKMLESQYLFGASSGIYPLLVEFDMRAFAIIRRKDEIKNGSLTTDTKKTMFFANINDYGAINPSLVDLAKKMYPYISIRDGWILKAKRRWLLKDADKIAKNMAALEMQLRKRDSPLPPSLNHQRV